MSERVERTTRDVLDEAQRLRDAGRLLDAYRVASRLGRLQDWPGLRGRVLAGRLASGVGAPKLGRALRVAAWRAAPDDVDAFYFASTAVEERRGAWAALNFLDRPGSWDAATPERRADLYSLRARLRGVLRDFESAEDDMREATALGDFAWPILEHAYLLETQDRYDEALAAAQEFVERSPTHVAGPVAVAHFQQLCGFTEAAVTTLADAIEREQGTVAVSAAIVLDLDLERWESAEEKLARFESHAPLLDEGGRKWLEAVRCKVAYHRGDIERAVELGRATTGYWHSIAERLERSSPAAKSWLVDVPFIRQHHMTCGPASISMVARCLDVEADHVEVAAEICYGGTSNHAERRWCEQRGLRTREFTLNTDDARSLLAAGVPFSVTTVEAASAHLQVVMGYDERRDVFVLRDPFHPSRGECLADEFLENYASRGPRSLAFVPAGHPLRLEQIPLRDAELYDDYHAVQDALDSHDRAAALDAARRIERASPGHRLSIEARLAIASYDRDDPSALECWNELLAQFPDDARLSLAKASCLRRMDDRSGRIELLEAMTSRPAPQFAAMVELATDLADDATRWPEAMVLLRRALRMNPTNALAHYTLGRIFMAQGEFEAGLRELRYAACLSDTDEFFAQHLARNATAAGQFERVEPWLRARVDRLRDRSGDPALTLAHALDAVDRRTEAIQVLEQAVTSRPDDLEFAVSSADVLIRLGNTEHVSVWLDRAEGRVKASRVLRSRARLAQARGDFSESEACWRRMLELEPFDTDAHEAFGEFLEQTHGPEAAADYLVEIVARFPFRRDLRCSYARTLGSFDAECAATVLRELLATDPTDAWSWRELALRLADLGRDAEAIEAAERGVRAAPHAAAGHGILGHVQRRAGQLADATNSLRRAVELDADYASAIHELCGLRRSDVEVAEFLDWLAAHVRDGSRTGAGVTAFADLSAHYRPGDRHLRELERLQAARPELLSSHIAVMQALRTAGRAEDSEAVGRAAADRFPMEPQVWFERSQTRRHGLHDAAAAIEALEHALSLQDGWLVAMRELSELHRLNGDLDAARALLERAVALAPMDALNHGWLADVQQEQGELDDALESSITAIRLAPSYGWALDRAEELAQTLGRVDRLVDFGETLAAQRPRDVHAWLACARLARDDEARRRAYSSAIEVAPFEVDAYHRLADTYTDDPAAAIEVLQSYPDQRLPVPMRGHVLSLRAQLEGPEAVIPAMRELLTENPSLESGHLELLDWLRATDDVDAYRTAARAACDANPTNTTFHAYLGEAETRSENRAGAIAAFELAHSLDPAYAYAARQLVELLLEERSFDRVEEVVERVRRGGSETLAFGLHARLAIVQRDVEAALERLAPVVSGDREAGVEWDRNVERMDQIGWDRHVDALAREAFDRPGVRSDVASSIVRRFVEAKRVRLARKLVERRLGDSELAQELAQTLLGELASNQIRRPLRRWIRSHADFLRRDDQTWGTVGFALVRIERFGQAAQWMADWRDRDVQPWMLLNLCEALRHQRRAEELERVLARLEDLEPDHSSPLHALWRAFDALLDGDFDGTDEGLAAGVDHGGSEFYECMTHLLRAALAFARGSETESDLRCRLATAPTKFETVWNHPVMDVIFQGVRTVVRRRAGLWTRWRLANLRS